jgi:hypothetical protein
MSVLGYGVNGRAEDAIGARLIAAYGATDGTVKQAAAATDKLIGVVELGADTAGQITDIQRNGPTKVRYGAAVARGDYLTSDALGRAVPVEKPAADTTVYYIGQANVSGVEDDICFIDLAPGVLKG